MTHLTKEESTKLVRYFMRLHRDDSLDIANKEIEDIKERCRVISELEQYDAEIRSYERESSFGRDTEEIKRNATEHIRNCLYCFTQYELAVKDEAMITMGAYKAGYKAVGAVWPDEKLSKLMRECIEREDVLGLLTHQE